MIDDTAWIIKTHSPWISVMQQPFKCNKMLLIVRNPLDTIVSLLHLWNTGNHVGKVPFDCEKEYPEYWDWWVKDTTAHIKNWFKIVMLDTKLRRVPGLFIRFEDLVNDPKP